MAKNKEGDIAKIVCIGGSLEFDLCLALTEVQYKNLNIDYEKVSSLTDLNKVNLSSLSSIISLTSDNFLLNSLLFVNRANRTKSFVEYIIPFTCKYNDDVSFMEEVVKSVTEKNFIFIEEFNLLNLTPRITLTLKKLNENDDAVLDKKIFIITESNGYTEQNGYNGDLFSGFNFEYDCAFLYSDIMELFKCKLNSYDEIHSFLTHVSDVYPSTAICINYSGYFDQGAKVEVDLVNSIGDVLALTDVFIFEEKEVSDYFTLMKSLNEENGKKIDVEKIFIKEIPNRKKSKIIKIGIIIDEMKTANVIQQDPNSFLVLFHSKFDINFIPKNIPQKDTDEYHKLLLTDYNVIKSVFVGGFLSRLFNKKSFQTCFVAGNESVKRVIDLIRFDFDYPTDGAYYEILVKKPRQKRKEDMINIKKENHFVLDCTNVITSKKKEYNPLYDQMCQSYFACANNRNHLHRLGFINKKGVILQDPDKKVFSSVKNKSLMNNYEKEKKELSKIKENNEMMKIQLRNLANSKYGNIKSASIDELMEMSSVYNFDKFSNKKLPSIISKSKSKNRENGDLYYKEIKNSKFLTKNTFYRKKNFSLNKNSATTNKTSKSKEEMLYFDKESIDSKAEKEKYIDKDNFISFLNQYETKLKEENKQSE